MKKMQSYKQPIPFSFSQLVGVISSHFTMVLLYLCWRNSSDSKPLSA